MSLIWSFRGAFTFPATQSSHHLLYLSIGFVHWEHLHSASFLLSVKNSITKMTNCLRSRLPVLYLVLDPLSRRQQLLVHPGSFTGFAVEISGHFDQSLSL